MPLGAAHDQGQRDSIRVDEEAALRAFFPRSVGLGPTVSRASGALTIAPSMLCQAQLTLMRAEIPLSGVRGIQVTPAQAGQTLKASHPYFWAPFILIGAGE